jgi:hypothetical protein
MPKPKISAAQRAAQHARKRATNHEETPTPTQGVEKESHTTKSGTAPVATGSANPTIDYVADKDNLLLTSAARRNVADFKGASSATSVRVPGVIYQRMREISDKDGVSPNRQMLNALRLDQDGGLPYAGDADETRPARGRNSGKNSHRVSIRIPAIEFLAIQEKSRAQDVPIAQMFLNAWKRAHAWEEPTKN